MEELSVLSASTPPGIPALGWGRQNCRMAEEIDLAQSITTREVLITEPAVYLKLKFLFYPIYPRLCRYNLG